MKTRLFILFTVLLAVFAPPAGLSSQNPSTHNAAGYATTAPPAAMSGYSDYTAGTSRQYDFNGNDIITGNVRSGKSFQGNIPYGSASSFTSTLGTSSLRSFLRDSTGPEDLGVLQSTASAGNYRSYSLPSQSVTNSTSLTTGQTGIVDSRADNNTQQNLLSSQPATNVSNNTSLDITAQSTNFQLYNPGPTAGQTQYSTLSESLSLLRSSAQTETSTSGQTDLPNQDNFSAEQYLNQLQANNNPAENSLDSTLQSTTTPDYSLYSQSSLPAMQSIPQNRTTAGITGNLNNHDTQLNKDIAQYQQPTETASTTSDVINDIQRQLDELIRSLDADLQTDTASSGLSTQEVIKPTSIESPYESIQSNQGIPGTVDNIQPIPEPELPEISIPQPQVSNVKPETFGGTLTIDEIIQSELGSSTEVVLGPHQDFDHLNQAKFNDRYWAAQQHLSAGRYAEAIDYFHRAEIYRPDEPLCLAGKAHAMFGAGEYASSSLAIISAIELCPEYLNIDIDISSILDEKLDNARQMLASSDSPDLNFLLAYALFRDGSYQQADEAIETTLKAMPYSKPAQALKSAISNKLGN